jgi:hypothetical protein
MDTDCQITAKLATVSFCKKKNFATKQLNGSLSAMITQLRAYRRYDARRIAGDLCVQKVLWLVKAFGWNGQREASKIQI